MIYSRQREVILGALQRTGQHPTADDLYGLVRDEEPAISMATIYRNLNQLVKSGLIQRVVVPGSADRYDAVNNAHLHMICTQCGRIEDIPSGAIPDVCAMAASATGYEVQNCELIFYGVCNVCRDASRQHQQ